MFFDPEVLKNSHCAQKKRAAAHLLRLLPCISRPFRVGGRAFCFLFVLFSLCFVFSLFCFLFVFVFSLYFLYFLFIL
jgi:hypothetical protein